MAITAMEGPVAVSKGCQKCHDVGKPNKDGSIGTCTACHARHAASVELARTPETCGQCHMGPDHSQLEIYHESKHGVLFNAQKAQHEPRRPGPKELTTEDMPVPTCATCHMSGLEGQKVTHDVTERLSYWLFAADLREAADLPAGPGQHEGDLPEVPHRRRGSISSTRRPRRSSARPTRWSSRPTTIIEGLREEKLLTPEPFDEPIEFVYFDLWHYYGRTAKHGAFMGGADFVQWHGFYEIERQARRAEEAGRGAEGGEGDGTRPRRTAVRDETAGRGR